MPYGVAMAKGFFKDEGINVTGLISSGGGGTSLRNMLTGGVPYGEVNPGVIVSAIQQGADLKIVSDTCAEGREDFEARLMLIRPDQHVAWTSDVAAADAGAVLRRVAGRA